MKTTIRLIALLSVAALAACAEPITGPSTDSHAVLHTADGTGFLGGGTRAEQP